MNKINLLGIYTIFTFFFCLPNNTVEAKANEELILSIDSLNLKKTVAFLSDLKPARNYKNPEILDSVADYIYNCLKKNADTVYYQNFKVKGINYKNVIAKYGIKHSKKIILGAHYDSCHDLPGADDNASGIAGLLEIGRNIPKQSLQHQIELVAYTLEEPPFFRTEQMGSAIHAKSEDKEKRIAQETMEIYWENNMRAVMITNTAFYRNKNYHTELDIKETLNYSNMAWVVEGVLNAVCNYHE